MKRRLRASAHGRALAIVFVVALASAACSNDGAGSNATENPPGTASRATPGGQAPGAQKGSASPNARPSDAASSRLTGAAPGTRYSTIPGIPRDVGRLLDRAHSAAATSFTATYRVTMASGKRATSRLSQRPPRFGFELVQGKERNVVVFDGRVMHGCLSSGGGWRCTQTSSVDDPTEVGSSYPWSLLHHVDGLVPVIGREMKASTTTRTVRGARVDCVSLVSAMPTPPPAHLLCVRPDGVLAYARIANGQVVELTGFTPSVNARDLVPPR